MSSFGEMASAALPDRHCSRHCCCHWQKGLPACNNVSAYVFSSQREIRSERESVCMCGCLCVCVRELVQAMVFQTPWNRANSEATSALHALLSLMCVRLALWRWRKTTATTTTAATSSLSPLAMFCATAFDRRSSRVEVGKEFRAKLEFNREGKHISSKKQIKLFFSSLLLLLSHLLPV